MLSTQDYTYENTITEIRYCMHHITQLLKSIQSVFTNNLNNIYDISSGLGLFQNLESGISFQSAYKREALSMSNMFQKFCSKSEFTKAR